jgi:hypothetical protein
LQYVCHDSSRALECVPRRSCGTCWLERQRVAETGTVSGKDLPVVATAAATGRGAARFFGAGTVVA